MSAVRAALLAVSLVAAVAAFRFLHDDLQQTVLRSLPAVAVGLSGVVAGLVAWARRPGNRVGPLMVAYGFAVLVRPWQYAGDDLVFTVGFLLSELSLALFAHVVLAYPSGRVTDGVERAFLVAAYGVVAGFPLATALAYDGSGGLNYVPPGTSSSIAVAGSTGLVEGLQRAFVVVAYGVLASCFVVLVLRKYLRATPRARHTQLPVLLGAVVAASRAVYEFLSQFVSPVPAIADAIYWWQVAGQIALPVALLAGLLTSRLAEAHVADLLRALDRTTTAGLRDALAAAVGDPTLELAYWLPAVHRYADAAGRPVDLPASDDRLRSVTRVDHDHEPVAALVHDPGLQDDPELLEAVAVAARLALENARLQAEVQAQLTQVRESRARILAAGDEQRRVIERNIHDGAQQRLVALALELRTAQRRLGAEVDPDLDAILAGAVDELQLAVAELRELARGVHPAILTEDGLAAALHSLAARSPLPVVVEAPDRRYPPEVEATAYFLACEALANAVKHASASRATIHVGHDGDVLVIEIADDGIGGAATGRGTGLAGLADRVDACGGRLLVDSPPGSGTRIVGELPCAS
jgi:signal transduction histidine kinase